MKISDDRIDDFMARWETVYSERLSREEARLIAVRLVNFYKLGRRRILEAVARKRDPTGTEIIHEAS